MQKKKQPNDDVILNTHATMESLTKEKLDSQLN